MNQEIIKHFETFAHKADLQTDKWVCNKHPSPFPGMYRKYETEIAWRAFKTGFELGVTLTKR